MADPLSAEGTADAQALAQRSLGRLGYSTARAVVEKWLDDQERAAAALASIADAPHDAWRAAMIERALSLESVATRCAAVRILDTMWLDNSAEEALWLKALCDPAEEVRLEAADRLGSYSRNPRIETRPGSTSLGSDWNPRPRRQRMTDTAGCRQTRRYAGAAAKPPRPRASTAGRD